MDTITQSQLDAENIQAERKGWLAGYAAAIDENKSKYKFYRGIGVGIFFGAMITLFIQYVIF